MYSYNSLSPFTRFRKEFDRVFNSAFSNNVFPKNVFPFDSRAFHRSPVSFVTSSNAFPRLNLAQDEDSFRVEAVMPGVDAASLDVSVHENTLTIKGEKKRSFEDSENASYIRRERASGKFSRSVELPVKVDANAISAEYKNGILSITLPKAEEAKPKAIEVKVS